MRVGMGAAQRNAVLLIWCAERGTLDMAQGADELGALDMARRAKRGLLDMARGADERGTLDMARGQTSAVRLIWYAEQTSAVRLIWRATQINAVRLTWRKTRPAAAVPCATQFIRRDAVRLSGACRPRRGVLAYRPHAAEPVCAWPTERTLPNCYFTTLN